MNNLIIDHFELYPMAPVYIAECSIDQQEYESKMSSYRKRTPVEIIYRLLYQYGFIKEGVEWIVRFNQVNAEVYFEMNLIFSSRNAQNLLRRFRIS